MQKLDETSLALFKDTPSKRFLIDVINVLADHGHVSIDAINQKDEEQSLVWNWLNKAASTFSVDKIIQLLQRLNLFIESKSVDLPVLTEYKMFTPRNEEDAKKVRKTQKKVRDDQRALLLQIQLATFDLIKNSILDKVPSAKWVEFKNGNIYKGKITYETGDKGDEAQLWFKNDGLIVFITEFDQKRTKCYTDTEIDAWIDAHPEAKPTTGTIITPQNVQAIADSIVRNYTSTNVEVTPLKTFKKQDKVLGIQKVYMPSIGDVEIWYRSTQGVFCKSQVGFKEFLTAEKLHEYLKNLMSRRG